MDDVGFACGSMEAVMLIVEHAAYVSLLGNFLFIVFQNKCTVLRGSSQRQVPSFSLRKKKKSIHGPPQCDHNRPLVQN